MASIKHDLPRQSRIEVLFPLVATLVVVVRFVLRRKYRIALRWDDALIGLSTVFTWGLWSVWIWTTTNLIGHRDTAMRPTTPPLLQKLCFAMDVFYGQGINIAKFAVLVFYLRAFASSPNDGKTRMNIYIIMGVVAAFAVARAVETAFLCPPICTGSPRDYNVAGWQFAMRAINWVTEFIILLFPVPILWGMSVPRKTKIGIYACFLLGILTCVASAGRLYSAIKLYLAQMEIAKIADTADAHDIQLWFYNYYIPQMSQMTLWSLAELNAGIIAASLPAIRSPVIALAKSAMGRIRTSRRAGDEPSCALDSSDSSCMVKHDYGEKTGYNDFIRTISV